MTRTCVCSKTLGRVALVFIAMRSFLAANKTCVIQEREKMKIPRLSVAIACLALAGAINAQAKEVAIYVSGPWIYAQDPKYNTRVVVFVPSATNTHMLAQIFPGGDYMHSGGKPNLYQGLYRLDLPTVSGQCNSSSNPYRLYEKLGIMIGGTVINDEVVNHRYNDRIAISLPTPACYVGVKTSESRVGTDPRYLTQDEYTTVMALHYFVADGPAHLSGASDDGTVMVNDDIAFVPPISGLPSISLVEMAKDSKSERKCDSYSHDSLDHSRRSLALDNKFFAQFPELRGDGAGQIKGKYNSCSTADVDLNQKRMAAAIETIKDIVAIRAYLDDPSVQNDPEASLACVKSNMELFFGGLDKVPSEIREEIEKAQKALQPTGDLMKKDRSETREQKTETVLEKTEEFVIPFTPGGGDCHMAQISVGGVVPMK
jgi:hypothetical protein